MKIGDLVRSRYIPKMIGIVLEVDNHESEDSILVQLLSGQCPTTLQYFTCDWYFADDWNAVPKKET